MELSRIRYTESSQRCINRGERLDCLDGATYAYETQLFCETREREKSDCQLVPVHESPFEKMPHTSVCLIVFSRWKNPWQLGRADRKWWLDMTEVSGAGCLISALFCIVSKPFLVPMTMF